MLITLLQNLTATLLLLTSVHYAAPDQVRRAEPVEDRDPVDEVLLKLERSADDLRTFTADIVYESYEDLLGKREIRTGELIYRTDAEAGTTSFAILFDALIVNQRRSERLKHYVFHERWLVEIDHEARQFIKREIVAPGKQFDPLKLGEGPIPLPIGQAKDDVLARFRVSIIDESDQSLLKDIEKAHGLQLVPRSGTPEADEYQRIELFYDRETLLPVGINAIETNDNRKTVRLRNLARNPALDAAQRAKLSVDEPDANAGWSIDVRPWQGEG